MEWVRTGTAAHGSLVFAAAYAGGRWVFRSPDAVLGWSGGPELDWSQTLEGDRLFGAKRLAVAGDRVLTLVDLGAGEPSEVAAFAGADGEPLWRRGYGGVVSSRGFDGAGGSVFLHATREGNDEEWQLRKIDPATGEVADSLASPAGRGIVGSGDRLWLQTDTEGTFLTTTRRLEWKPLPGISPAQVVAAPWGALIVARPGSGKPADLVAVDADGKELGRISSDTKNAPLAVASDAPGRAAMCWDQRRVRVVDPTAGKELWTLEAPEGETLGIPLWVGDTLLMAVQPNGTNGRVQVHDGATGEVTGQVPITVTTPENLYWVNDRLVVSAYDGLELFERKG